MSEVIYYTDILGVEIEPGCLIATGKSSDSKTLRIGIVSTVNKKRISLFGKKGSYNYKTGEYIYKLSRSASWTEVGRNVIQTNIVVIREPLYALTNPTIAATLAIADDLKDAGLVPSNYELGIPFSYDDSGKPVERYRCSDMGEEDR